MENNLGLPANWRERGLASPSLRHGEARASGRATTGAGVTVGTPGRSPLGAPQPAKLRERRAQATRVCPLASVGTRKQPATRAGLSGIKLLLNIIMPHQKQNLARLVFPNKKHIVCAAPALVGSSLICALSALQTAKSRTVVYPSPEPAPRAPGGTPAAPLAGWGG